MHFASCTTTTATAGATTATAAVAAATAAVATATATATATSNPEFLCLLGALLVRGGEKRQRNAALSARQI